jgi:hypothetical protein
MMQRKDQLTPSGENNGGVSLTMEIQGDTTGKNAEE